MSAALTVKAAAGLVAAEVLVYLLRSLVRAADRLADPLDLGDDPEVARRRLERFIGVDRL
jgi:hypothetical protein